MAKSFRETKFLRLCKDHRIESISHDYQINASYIDTYFGLLIVAIISSALSFAAEKTQKIDC